MALGLAGLFVLADWVGSSERWFHYTAPLEGDETLALYWDRARSTARDAIVEAGIVPAKARPFGGLRGLFTAIETKSPVQAFAEDVALPEGALLAIVEDVTGSGKTEAALTLAHRLIADGRASGLYLALPTEATANAMYMRLGQSYQRLFATEATPSLVLAHGRTALHQGFRDSIVDAAGQREARYARRDDADERPSSAECAEWIADDRRKAFLADVGAGTIDQALLAILPVKHQSLRLWGLAGSVLIIDEAHAYDAYMTRELETLLEFHAALGGSAIILSATLPRTTRERLCRSFRRGRVADRTPDVALQTSAYPLVTLAGAERIEETAQPIREGLARFVRATRVGDRAGAIERVRRAAEAGACVAFVRNSVDEAIAAAAELSASGLEPLLFHARFAMIDRQRIEAEVMRRFGRDSTAAARWGRVLVATQVIEQSLDLDFDLVVTDIAPVDLLIQRAGRLWRHRREARPIDGPELVVLSGAPEDAPDKDWANAVLGRGARVYPDHALLWRSARALFRAGGIATPEGVRTLVEAVYDVATQEAPPPTLSLFEIRGEGEAKAAASMASTNVLVLRAEGRGSAGYRADAGLWDSDVRTPTRLAMDTRRVRLGKYVDGDIRPWAEADAPWRAWALSEVNVRVGRIAAQDDSDPDLAAAVARAKQAWPEFEREVPLLGLRGEGAFWSGAAVNSAGNAVPIGYTQFSGLAFDAT